MIFEWITDIRLKLGSFRIKLIAHKLYVEKSIDQKTASEAVSMAFDIDIYRASSEIEKYKGHFVIETMRQVSTFARCGKYDEATNLMNSVLSTENYVFVVNPNIKPKPRG